MSLQLAAKHLAAKGRGPDTQLVHMSMGELKSLQDLAKAHGGAITTNPDTGLPEAGFLSSILPMVAGAALTATGIGAPMAALLVGGGMTAATGSLNKGLMAGLGAFGGAGLAGGLMSAGAAGAGTAAEMAGGLSGASAGELAAAQQAAASGAGQGFGANISQMGQGISSMTTDPAARSAFMSKVGGGAGLFKYGAAGLAPMLMGGEDKGAAPAIKPTPPVTPMQFNANPVTPTPAPDVPGYGNLGQDFGRQQRYFNPTFTPVTPPAPVTPVATTTPMSDPYMYSGGMAAGGPVEAMSYANVYDMQNARGGVSDMGVDMSTGMERMAEGGITGSGELNLNIPLNFGGGSDFGGRFNQGPLDFGQNRTGFGQAAANGYQSVGSGASSSPPGFLAPKPSSTVGLTENPFNLGTQLASRLGSANQNPFAAQPTTEMMAAQREATPFNPAFDLADLQRRVGDREESFNEFENRRRMRRHPGDQVPTAAELQSEYKDYVQDRNNNLAKIGDLQQVLSRQAQQKEMFDRINAMQQQIPQMAEGGETDPTKYKYERGAGGLDSMADRTSPSVIADPATTIAIGQALQGYGSLGFMPGAGIASMLGHGMTSSGITALGAMESQAAADASNAAAASQANAGLGSAVDASGEAMGMARGGISDLGDYSDGGRLLRGPGDGVSDSIPAMIGRKQPARLADGEFVVPARIVSELGNGSTEAGARKLYAMMDRVQRARGKTVGKGRVAKNTRADKYLPA